MRFIIGDGTAAISKPEVDASELTFFDEMEYESWELFKGYSKLLGIDIHPENNDIDFYIAKQIQETVLKIFEDGGIKIVFN